MTTSVVATTRVSAPARGGLSYIPTVAFGTDLVLITFSVFAAILGRETIPFAGYVPTDVGDALDVAGPVMIIGWVAAIFLLGGYRPQVFGAGLRRVQEPGQRLAADRRRGRHRLLPAPVPALPRLLRAGLRASASRCWCSAGSCCAAASTAPGSPAPCSTAS